MNSFLIALLLASGGTLGTIESVREVPAAHDLHAFDPAVLEHSIRPPVAKEVLVQLDEGWAVTLVTDAEGGLRPGQRVRVLSSYDGLQLQAD